MVLSLQPPATVSDITSTDFGTMAVGTRQLATRGRAEVLSEAHDPRLLPHGDAGSFLVYESAGCVVGE